MLPRWKMANGYRDVLRISLPLVVSMASNTVMQFTDRIFLAKYSVEAIAAAVPAGIMSFLFLCFFMGVGTFVNVLVAQYTGAGRPERVGASLWQGIHFSIASGAVLAALSLTGPVLFHYSGHPPEVARLELIYFQILTLGAGFGVLAATLSCFFSGRGMTRPVMVVHLAAAVVNIPLDYALIYGVWGMPEMGIAGAAIASVAATVFAALMLAALIFTRQNDRLFNVRGGWRPDRDLFLRLMRFGLPSGAQFFLELAAFTFFFYMLGRLGKVELAASNIVLSINTLAFLPMVGFSVGVSSLVGQALGRGKPAQAREAAISTLHITLSYIGLVALSFLLTPGPLMEMFRGPETAGADFAVIKETGVILLRFVVIYTFFDAFSIILQGVLKGAGDTRFVMLSLAATGLGLMVLPLHLCLNVLELGLYPAWGVASAYICSLGVVFWLRFKGGAWQNIRVI